MVELKELWKEAPWTLRAYIAVGAFLSILDVALNGTTFRWVALAAGVALSYFLLRRVRWLWLLDIAVTALYFIGFLFVLGTNAIFMFTALVLLLASPTRRHFARRPVPLDS